MRQQALKVIGFYKGKTWMEASHVFSYYVVKSIIFNNLGMVETWLGSSMDTFDRQEDFYNFITKIIDKDFPTLKMQPIQNAGFDLRMIDVDLNYIFT
jgi:hypothetical protein